MLPNILSIFLCLGFPQLIKYCPFCKFQTDDNKMTRHIRIKHHRKLKSPIEKAYVASAKYTGQSPGDRCHSYRWTSSVTSWVHIGMMYPTEKSPSSNFIWIFLKLNVHSTFQSFFHDLDFVWWGASKRMEVLGVYPTPRRSRTRSPLSGRKTLRMKQYQRRQSVTFHQWYNHHLYPLHPKAQSAMIT